MVMASLEDDDAELRKIPSSYIVPEKGPTSCQTAGIPFTGNALLNSRSVTGQLRYLLAISNR
jgi:hypothetical protein